MRRAIEQPERQYARQQLNEGIEALENVIQLRGSVTAYPYHVLGSQALNWTRLVPILKGLDKRDFLEGILGTVKRGVERHPWSKELKVLAEDIEKEILYTVTVRPGESSN